jgi:hypothetical protein
MNLAANNEDGFGNHYTTDGSSNIVTNGKPLNISIKIRPTADPKRKIRLKGIFKAGRISVITTDDHLGNLSCRLLGGTGAVTVELAVLKYNKTDDAFTANAGNTPSEYDYLIVEITGGVCTWSVGGASTLKFYDANYEEGATKAISAEFALVEDDKFSIDKFTVDNAVRKDDDNNITLTWVKHGGDHQRLLIDGRQLDVEPKKNKDNPSEFSVTYECEARGDHYFTIEVSRQGAAGPEVCTKSLTVRYLKSATSYKVEKKDIVNFCDGSDGSMLFALVNDKGQGAIQAVEYSVDGFSDWNRLVLTEKDRDLLKPFTFSPLIHLKNPGEMRGKLVLIGGSKIHANWLSNRVAILDLDEYDSEAGNSIVSIIENTPGKKNIPWGERMGHSCSLFPHGGATNKIWLIGGQGKNGSALNEVWVSGDGIHWENLNQDGTVNNNTGKPAAMPWKPRCLFATAVQFSGKEKSELWIGGGFEEYGGAAANNLWRWDKKEWRPVMKSRDTQLGFADDYFWSALFFVGQEPETPGIYKFSCTADRVMVSEQITYIDTQYYDQIKLQDLANTRGMDTDFIQKVYGQSTLITCYFRGYIWFMSYTDKGDAGTQVSPLYYYVPKFEKLPIIIE